MNMPERLTKCPRTRECSAKVVFRDGDGNLFRFNEREKTFAPHVCRVQNASKLPELGYCAEWYNKATGRTRYTGPFRMRKSAEIEPNDERYRKRDANPDWVLKQIYVADFIWKSVDE